MKWNGTGDSIILIYFHLRWRSTALSGQQISSDPTRFKEEPVKQTNRFGISRGSAEIALNVHVWVQESMEVAERKMLSSEKADLGWTTQKEFVLAEKTEELIPSADTLWANKG